MTDPNQVRKPLSFTSLQSAASHIKSLLKSESGHLKNDPTLDGTGLATLATCLLTDSPVDVDNIFCIPLDFSDAEQVGKQKNDVEQKLKALSTPAHTLLSGYIWVEISQEGQLVVVGKSTTSEDLFSLYQMPIGKTAKALVKRYCSDEDQAVIRRCAERINREIAGAVIIPVLDSGKGELDSNKYLSKVETLIGEVIVKAYGAINPDSHTG